MTPTERQTCRRPGQRQLSLVDQPWVQELLVKESFTGEEAGKLSGRYGPDALTQLRNGKGLKLITLGPLPGGHPKAKVFRLERKEQ